MSGQLSYRLRRLSSDTVSSGHSNGAIGTSPAPLNPPRLSGSDVLHRAVRDWTAENRLNVSGRSLRDGTQAAG